jgi:hypothetical protein
MTVNLNKYSRRVTHAKRQRTSQAMLYGTGLTEADMDNPQIGIAVVWYEGTTYSRRSAVAQGQSRARGSRRQDHGEGRAAVHRPGPRVRLGSGHAGRVATGPDHQRRRDYHPLRRGPKGGPGMPEMLTPTSAIMGVGLGADVALLTDDRFPRFHRRAHHPGSSGRRAARPGPRRLPDHHRR